MKIMFIVVAVFYFALIENVQSLKILVYQTALGRSHVQHIGSVVDTLVEAGHDVVSFLVYIQLFYGRFLIEIISVIAIIIIIGSRNSSLEHACKNKWYR